MTCDYSPPESLVCDVRCAGSSEENSCSEVDGGRRGPFSGSVFSIPTVFLVFSLTCASSFLFLPFECPLKSLPLGHVFVQGRGKDVLTKVRFTALHVFVHLCIYVAAVAPCISPHPLLSRVCVLGVSGAVAKAHAPATRARGNVKLRIQWHFKSLNREAKMKRALEFGGQMCG